MKRKKTKINERKQKIRKNKKWRIMKKTYYGKSAAEHRQSNQRENTS